MKNYLKKGKFLNGLFMLKKLSLLEINYNTH